MNKEELHNKTIDHMIENGYDPDIPEECLSYCNWIDNQLRNIEYKNPDYIKDVNKNLASVHPYFLEATICDVIWELNCKNCNGKHMFDEDTTTLDRCCKYPDYGEISYER